MQGCWNWKMKLDSLMLRGAKGWPDVILPPLTPGLNVLYGPDGAGKTTLAELLGHVLYGKLPGQPIVPAGEVVVTTASGRFRLRRWHADDVMQREGAAASRLTIAALDRAKVDGETVRGLLGGISPGLLGRLCTIGFDTTPHVDATLAAEFAREFRGLAGESDAKYGGRTAQLAARRDLLAKVLETQIAGERRTSGELDRRQRELDARIRDSERDAAALDLRLRAVESALAETDARLRYRRLELNAELHWREADSGEWQTQLAELDAKIAHWRTMLADVAQREADVRVRLTETQPGRVPEAALGEQRAWLAVARQLAADLAGEVARLARASAIGPGEAREQDAGNDAHSRLRPIVETLARQLDGMERLLIQQQQANQATAATGEAEQLARMQAALRGQLDFLLDRRQALARGTAAGRIESPIFEIGDTRGKECTPPIARRSLSAADAEQLEQRRLELEQERFEVTNRIRARRTELRDLCCKRSTMDQQRAALLSTQSIEPMHAELKSVQHELERAASFAAPTTWDTRVDQPGRASDYLAQLTDGRLVRLQLSDVGQYAVAVRESGVSTPLELLPAAERELACLSFALALVSAAARRGVGLPLVLDNPFLRRDARGTAALAAVLNEFGRQGHQVVALTGQPTAAARLKSLGVQVHDLIELRRWRRDEEPLAISMAESVQLAGPRIAPPPPSAGSGKAKRKRQAVAAPSRRRRRAGSLRDRPPSADGNNSA
jgi:hypothetical protein